MKRTLMILVAALAFLSAPAFATQPTKPQPGAISAAAAQAIAVAVQQQIQLQMQAQIQAQKQAQDQTQKQAQQLDARTGDVSVQIQHERAVASAIAAGLVASNGTCLGSKSGGAQGASFGISIAGTVADDGCDVRYDAANLRAAGHPEAADARLCQKPEIAEAFAAAGKPCVDKRKGTMKTSDTSGYTGNDPIVKARLGVKE